MNKGRTFLFLQGPPGPMFRLLATAMRKAGADVHRINLNAGDRHDWGEGGTDYRGDFSGWATFLDRFLRRHAITDLLLFGDCRPYHIAARGIANLRGIDVHVLEEGYIRPDWMTLEPEGVNGRSMLPRDIQWYRDIAATLPPEKRLPGITASFRRRVRDSYWYYHHVFFGRWRFPHFRNHRSPSVPVEAIGWCVKYLLRGRRRRATERALVTIGDKRFFVFPMQLSGDYQIRAHSPFQDMKSATRYVLESFAAYAPADVHLLVKAHPLDCSLHSWRRFVMRLARDLGVGDRVRYLDGGDLDALAQRGEGMVCVNSTSATLALLHDKPVCTLGDAVYAMPGLTHQGHIDGFWTAPQPPAPGAYAAYRRVLVDRILVRGGLASMSAVRTLNREILKRFGLPASKL